MSQTKEERERERRKGDRPSAAAKRRTGEDIFLSQGSRQDRYFTLLDRVHGIFLDVEATKSLMKPSGEGTQRFVSSPSRIRLILGQIEAARFISYAIMKARQHEGQRGKHKRKGHR